MVGLYMWAAMRLLDHLTKDSAWKTNGQDVAHQFYKFSIPIVRKKRKKDNRAQEPEPPQGTSEKVIVRLHLSPERTEKLLKFLTLHERTIRREDVMMKPWRPWLICS